MRGLDYYSHTAIEITSDQLGAQATVCSGGRYDVLIGQLGGPPNPAIGWALGLERLLVLLGQSEGVVSVAPPPDLYVISRGERAEPLALVLALGLRRLGEAESGEPLLKDLRPGVEEAAPELRLPLDDLAGLLERLG